MAAVAPPNVGNVANVPPNVPPAHTVETLAVAQMNKANALANEAWPPGSKGGFLRDILSDANGISFHRFQILAWTVVLGLTSSSRWLPPTRCPRFPRNC